MSITSTNIIKDTRNTTNLENRFNCAIIQPSFSLNDFNLLEQYPALKIRVSDIIIDYVSKINNTDLIIIPESILPTSQNIDGHIIEQLKEIAQENNVHILSSIILNESENSFNTVMLINSSGEIQDIYKKKNLVPFVESHEYKPGNTNKAFSVNKHIIAPLICFDSVFLNNYIRSKQPDIYIVTSNNAFAENTILSNLHKAYTIFNSRTIGLPTIQNIQNGPSFFIDRNGVLNNVTNAYDVVYNENIIIQ